MFYLVEYVARGYFQLPGNYLGIFTVLYLKFMSSFLSWEKNLFHGFSRIEMNSIAVEKAYFQSPFFCYNSVYHGVPTACKHLHFIRLS